MDLKALYSILNKKKFYYFEGHSSNDNLYIYFSTDPGGRGDAIELRIGNINNDIHIWIRNYDPPKPDTEFQLICISDNEILSLIETI
jgi:hypothetical protein